MAAQRLRLVSVPGSSQVGALPHPAPPLPDEGEDPSDESDVSRPISLTKDTYRRLGMSINVIGIRKPRCAEHLFRYMIAHR
jgi:hypothetical protein